MFFDFQHTSLYILKQRLLLIVRPAVTADDVNISAKVADFSEQDYEYDAYSDSHNTAASDWTPAVQNVNIRLTVSGHRAGRL